MDGFFHRRKLDGYPSPKLVANNTIPQTSKTRGSSDTPFLVYIHSTAFSNDTSKRRPSTEMAIAHCYRHQPVVAVNTQQTALNRYVATNGTTKVLFSSCRTILEEKQEQKGAFISAEAMMA
jgi:hypothetical protein